MEQLMESKIQMKYSLYRNSGAANTAMRKLAVSLADSWDLRIILSVFYTIVEVFRSSQEEDSDEFKKIQEEFRTEIGKIKILITMQSHISVISSLHSYYLCSSTNQ